MNIEQQNATPINREFKSDVFKSYFSIKKNAVELYNALNNSSYSEDDLTLNTLEKSIYMKMYNDVSFLVSGTVNLYEHQSSVNPNMPLRDLFYISDMFKPFGFKNDLYGSKLIKVPTPNFIVFYNGTYDAPDKHTIKLSDAYMQKTDFPQLELNVTVLNVNYGHNKELMDKCISLKDYSIFNYRVRENVDLGMDIESAVTLAVDSCIRDHIMEDYLMQEKAGVINMHVLDFNEELHEQSLREEGYEKGLSQGVINVAKNMISNQMDFNEISQLTLLSKEEVENLAKSMQSTEA